MAVEPLAVIDTVVVLIGARNDHASALDGVNSVFYLKGNVSAEVDVDLTFLMNMGLVLIQWGGLVQLHVAGKYIYAAQGIQLQGVFFHQITSFGDYTMFFDVLSMEI
jgi:hypothetical protein